MRRTKQRVNSYKSPYRNIQGARDTGQRYVVSYQDGIGERKDYGFTDSLEAAQGWVEQLGRRPSWSHVRIRDRGEKKAA